MTDYSEEIVTTAHFGCICQVCSHVFPVRMSTDFAFGGALFAIRCPNCLSTDGVDVGSVHEIPAELYETYTVNPPTAIDMAHLASLRGRIKRDADRSSQPMLPGMANDTEDVLL